MIYENIQEELQILKQLPEPVVTWFRANKRSPFSLTVLAVGGVEKIQKSIMSPLIPQTEAKSSLESANFIKMFRCSCRNCTN